MIQPFDNLHVVTGTKSTPLSAISSWAQLSELNPEESVHVSAYARYKAVPFLYRAVDLRAKGAQRVPLGLYRDGNDQDLSSDPAFEALMQSIQQLLFLNEASLCLYGATYNIKERNAFGKNITPRWMQPQSITPWYEETIGVIYFERQLQTRRMRLELEQVIYVWLPNLAAEIGPGVPPAIVALNAAGVLQHVDTYLAGYFEGGAVKATLLQVEGNPIEAERKKLESWWKRIASGVRAVRHASAISAKVNPLVIGDALRDTVNKDLTAQEREDIATAFGVPYSLMMSNAANYATAQQDWFNFYDQTVIPAVTLQVQAFNTQWLQPLGLRLTIETQRLEAYQYVELQKAQSVQALVGSTPILTVNEGRELLGYAPLQQAAEPAPTQSSESVDAAAEPEDDAEDDADDQLVEEELERYQRKARKALKSGRPAAVPFASTVLDADVCAELDQQLRDCHSIAEIKAVFAGIKAQTLTPEERALAEALTRILGTIERSVLRAIIADQPLDLESLMHGLSAALLPAVTSAALTALDSLANEIGLDLDEAQAVANLMQWSTSYSAELVQGLTTTTKTLLEQAITTYRATPMNRATLEALLKPAFGQRRAESIAVTEITRAASQANTHYQQYLAEAGLTFVRVNNTNADDRVCAICGPLNNKPEADWPNPAGPPWHPRCRCAVTLRKVTVKP